MMLGVAIPYYKNIEESEMLFKKLMDEILDFFKHKKLYCKDAIYYYNYGYNPNSLIVRYKRNEISKERC